MDGGEAGIFGFERRGGRRCRAEDFEGLDSGGLLDLPESDASSRTPASPCRRAADRVTGAKYPSRASVSERDGDGDMTRGVSGIALDVLDMFEDFATNGGRGENQIKPRKGRAQVCLSLARVPPSINELARESMMGNYLRRLGGSEGTRNVICGAAHHM